MAKSGQQHSKADVGGQRPAKDGKQDKTDDKSTGSQGTKTVAKPTSEKKR